MTAKLDLVAGPFYIGDTPVGVATVPGFGRRIVKMTVPKNSEDGRPVLGRVSTCFHGVGLRPAYTPRSGSFLSTTDEDLCRLCVFERDRLK